MLLNPEIRKLILAAWEWKSSLVTPFDEHQALEIEDEKVHLIKSLSKFYKYIRFRFLKGLIRLSLDEGLFRG